MVNNLTAFIHADRGQIQSDASDLARAAGPIAAAASLPDASGQSDTSSGSFMDSFKHAIQSVDAKERAAADQMADVDSGRSDDLVGAMLSSQEASLSFAMLMQVRNKVMGAMDELVKLPV